MVYFKEEQRFKQVWIWIIVISSSLVIIGTIVKGLYTQLFLGIPSSISPLSDTTLILLSALILFLVSIMIWGFAVSRLQLVIKNRSIYYKFIPFIWSWKKIDNGQISTYEIRPFSPVTYGGYGYRWTFRRGIGLIVNGDQGLYIVTTQNKKLLISTQKPKELKDAMDKLMQKESEDV